MNDLSARYEIGDRIGGGAMSDVYRAHDREGRRDGFMDQPALSGG